MLFIMVNMDAWSLGPKVKAKQKMLFSIILKERTFGLDERAIV